MTRRVFNYGGGLHSPTALTAFLRDALDGDVADGMKVVAGSGMNVTVQAGTARVGKDPAYDINIVGSESVDVGAASPSNPMNAVIVAYVDRSVQGTQAVTDNTNDVFKLKAVSGAAASSPADPSTSAIQSAIGASNPYIILARVRKRAGASSLIEGDITDLRKMVTFKPGRISAPDILADGIIESNHSSDGIVLPRHFSKTNWPMFAAVVNTNQSVPLSAFTKVNLPNVSYNVGNGYNGGTSTFTAPVTGIYHFDAAIKTNASTANRLIGRLNIAGIDNRFYDGTGGLNGATISGSMDVKMNAGETAFMEAWMNGGGTINAEFGSSSSLSGRLVAVL